MNNKVIGIAAFIGGALVGSFVTWRVTKTKYEQIMEEEAQSFRDVINKNIMSHEEVRDVLDEPEEHEEHEEITKDDISSYKEMLDELKYSTVKSLTKGEDTTKYPYVITPEEYGEHDGYDVISLDYYADDVLVDDMGEVVEKDFVEEMLGTDFKNRFGEYDANAVFVRDDVRMVDYEVLRDPNPYYGDGPSE